MGTTSMTDQPATPPSGGDLYARIIACMQAHPSGSMTDSGTALAARLEGLLGDALSALSDVESAVNQAYVISTDCEDSRVDDSIARSHEDVNRLRRRLERTIDMLDKGRP